MEVGTAASTPESVTKGGGEHRKSSTLAKPGEKLENLGSFQTLGTFPTCYGTCHACLDIRYSNGLVSA